MRHPIPRESVRDRDQVRSAPKKVKTHRFVPVSSGFLASLTWPENRCGDCDAIGPRRKPTSAGQLRELRKRAQPAWLIWVKYLRLLLGVKFLPTRVMEVPIRIPLRQRHLFLRHSRTSTTRLITNRKRRARGRCAKSGVEWPLLLSTEEATRKRLQLSTWR